jgi:hypothetical protein
MKLKVKYDEHGDSITVIGFDGDASEATEELSRCLRELAVFAKRHWDEKAKTLSVGDFVNELPKHMAVAESNSLSLRARASDGVVTDENAATVHDDIKEILLASSMVQNACNAIAAQAYRWANHATCSIINLERGQSDIPEEQRLCGVVGERVIEPPRPLTPPELVHDEIEQRSLSWGNRARRRPESDSPRGLLAYCQREMNRMVIELVDNLGSDTDGDDKAQLGEAMRAATLAAQILRAQQLQAEVLNRFRQLLEGSVVIHRQRIEQQQERTYQQKGKDK